MNELTKVQIKLLRPHKAQRQVLLEAERYCCMACGRRFGKTMLGMELAARTAHKGLPASWYAPTYKDAAEVWREFKRTLHQAIVDKSETEKRIQLITGGTVDVWTLDNPDSGRGRKNARVIIDEAAKVAKLEEAWTETIRPTLTDLKGDAWFLSTPKGRNYFWRLFQNGQSGLPGWVSWQMPTTANPYIDPAEVEDARQQLPQSAFAQEYLAEFTDDAGAVFRNVRACVDPSLNGAEPEAGRTYYGGLDWAQLNDFTVITVVDDQGRVCLADRFNQVAWETQYGRVKAASERWDVSTGQAEINSIGSPNLELLHKSGLHQWQAFNTTNESKSQIIQALALAFERQEIRIPDDQVLIAELEAFEANRLPSGKWRYEAPSGMHDDTVISLALAWDARQRPQGMTIVEL